MTIDAFSDRPLGALADGAETHTLLCNLQQQPTSVELHLTERSRKAR